MEMGNYYEGSIESGWTSIKVLTTPSASVKTCPKFWEPIKNIRRYGRIIKKSILDMQNRNFLITHGDRLNEITKDITSFVGEMNNGWVELKKGLEELSKIDSR